MDMSKRLLVLRTEKKVRQEDVARATGISLNGYKQVEHGDCSPTLKTLVALADYFNVSIDYIVGRAEDRK